jgi:hypothetical protein
MILPLIWGCDQQRRLRQINTTGKSLARIVSATSSHKFGVIGERPLNANSRLSRYRQEESRLFGYFHIQSTNNLATQSSRETSRPNIKPALPGCEPTNRQSLNPTYLEETSPSTSRNERESEKENVPGRRGDGGRRRSFWMVLRSSRFRKTLENRFDLPGPCRNRGNDYWIPDSVDKTLGYLS